MLIDLRLVLGETVHLSLPTPSQPLTDSVEAFGSTAITHPPCCPASRARPAIACGGDVSRRSCDQIVAW